MNTCADVQNRETRFSVRCIKMIFSQISPFLCAAPYFALQFSEKTFTNVCGGMANNTPCTDALSAVRSLLSLSRDHFEALGVTPIRHLLLSGPPGVGKTHAVVHAAKCLHIPIHFVVPGANACARIISAFNAAQSFTKKPLDENISTELRAHRAIIFIDELDAICPASPISGTPAASSIASLLSSLLDKVQNSLCDFDFVDLFVIAATNRPAAIHHKLLRTGRFHRHVILKAPDVSKRIDFLHSMFPTISIGVIQTLSNRTPGFVAADLAALCRKARSLCVKHCQKESRDEIGDGLSNTGAVCSLHLIDAIKDVTPSALRTSIAPRLADTTWESIAGASDVKHRLQMAVEWPLLHKCTFNTLGLIPPRGILLHGPPGCSKTTLVRAAANAARAPFLRLTAADIFSSYVGDSERVLRDAFAAARAAAPCVLFLDEIDALVGKRNVGGSDNTGSVQYRVLSTLLTEMDGVSAANDVLVVAATNRVDILDEALLRPGRFDDVLYVGLPDTDTREDILVMYSDSMPLSNDVELGKIAEASQGWSGADLKALCTEAALVAMREFHFSFENGNGNRNNVQVHMRHFMMALQQHTKSLSSPELSPSPFSDPTQLRS